MRLLILFLFAVLTGCAHIPGAVEPPLTPTADSCLKFYRQQDRAIARAGVQDWQYQRIPGLPYLRASRFAFSIAAQSIPPDEPWLAQLALNDLEARYYELQNLRGTAPNLAPLEQCQQLLLDEHLPAQVSKLTAFEPRDHYSEIKRVLGLYWLTRLGVSQGVKSYHREAREGFERPLEDIPVRGELKRYTFSGEYQDTWLLPPIWPEENHQTLKALFTRYAPAWEVDQLSRDDALGFPGWGDDGVSVDTAHPVTFYLPSYTLFEGKVLRQLNYIIWFPARTDMGALDIYAGNVDGLNLRITLDENDQPLLVDTMHNCGCYHSWFPSSRLKLDEHSKPYREPPLILQWWDEWPQEQQLVVRLSAVDHQVQRLYFDRDGGEGYTLMSYNRLRSLPNPQGRRSLFAEQGLVPTSERPERVLFWPMGVLSAGAMRQWGNHATAFVGRRHFDDPDMLDRIFDYRQ